MNDELELELMLGTSHLCNSCGKTFLATGDRCPLCGSMRIQEKNKQSKSGKVVSRRMVYDPTATKKLSVEKIGDTPT